MTIDSGAVGALCEGLPSYVYDPPIEAVVFGWGVNEDGQLGLDTEDNLLAPKVVEALLGTRFRGRDYRRSPLVAGSRNTLAVSAEGEVFGWGWNARATLGHGHRNPERKPRRVSALRGVEIVQVALGGWHCLALDIAGQCYSWGGNEYEQCGQRVEEGAMRDVVHPMKCLTQLKVQQVAAGGMHSLALTESGQIWMWGEPWGDFSMTIDRTPRRIELDDRFVAIACGAFHNLALNSEGQLYTWGINDYGQLGNGTTSYATSPQPISQGLEGVILSDIAAGGWHSLAISSKGEVYIWGRGEYGRLGLGDKSGSSKLRPTKMKSLEGYRIVEGSCGGTHTMVITNDGRAFIWGRGAFGRCGDGTERDHISPVEVKLPGGPERWRIITGAVGGRHSLVLALPNKNGEMRKIDRTSSSAQRDSGGRRMPRRSGSSSGIDRSYQGSAVWQAAEEADDEAGGGESSPDGISIDGEHVADLHHALGGLQILDSSGLVMATGSYPPTLGGGGAIATTIVDDNGIATAAELIPHASPIQDNNVDEDDDFDQDSEAGYEEQVGAGGEETEGFEDVEEEDGGDGNQVYSAELTKRGLRDDAPDRA